MSRITESFGLPDAAGSKRCTWTQLAKGPSTCRSVKPTFGTTSLCSATHLRGHGALTVRTVRSPLATRPPLLMVTSSQGGVSRSNAPGRVCQA